MIWTFKVCILLNDTLNSLLNYACTFKWPLIFKKNIWSQTYMVTRRSAHSLAPFSLIWLCCLTRSLQAVLKNPAVGLQCFQMWPAWTSGTAHLCVNVSTLYHTPITHHASVQQIVTFCWRGKIIKLHVCFVDDVSGMCITAFEKRSVQYI